MHVDTMDADNFLTDHLGSFYPIMLEDIGANICDVFDPESD